MADEPFIDPQSRPDLTVNLDSRVGDLSARQLSDILGTSSASAKPLAEKNAVKEIKDTVDHKAQGKEILDNKHHKEQKDHKDQKEQKDTKDHKEQKDTKDTKDHKEQVDHKAQKDHKDQKDGIKDGLKDHGKEFLKEIEKQIKEVKENDEGKTVGGEGKFDEGQGGINQVSQPGIDELVQRVSGLEQQVAAQQGGGG